MATRLGMVQAWVGQKLLKFLRCPIFALGPRFHKNPDILEVVHYNVKLILPYRPGDKKQLKAQDVTAKLVRFDILCMVPKKLWS
jgi:hypothetical protein